MKASRNLFSLIKIVNNGAKIVLDNTSIKILNQKDELVKVGKFDGRFWWLEFNLINMKDRMNGAVLCSEDVKQDEVRRSDHTYSKGQEEKGDHNYSRPENVEVTSKDIKSEGD